MSDPFTKEKCGVCGIDFEIPMVKDRRLGWMEQDASIELNYCQVEEFSEEKVCGDCFQSIHNAVTSTVESLKKELKEDLAKEAPEIVKASEEIQ